MTPLESRAMGMDGMIQPIKTSCSDHEGAFGANPYVGWKELELHLRLVHVGSKVLAPMVKAAAAKHAAEKEDHAEDCSKEK